MKNSGLSIAGSSEGRSIVRLTTARVTIIVLALVVLLSGLYFAGKSGGNAEVYSNDFSVYYHAAREVIAGRDPYQHSLGDWTPYIYPPLLAELIVPLAILPLPVAAYFWFLINAASIVAAAWMSARLASDGREPDSAALKVSVPESSSWRAAIAACAVVIVIRFVLDTFNLGQVNAMVAALAVAHVYLYARDRKALSAVALVVAVSIKLTPALLLLYHAAKLRLKFASACAALLVAVTVVSFLPFGSDSVDAFRVFVNRTVKNEQGYDLAYAGNQSLRGAIARLTDQPNEASLSSEGDSRRPAEAVTLLISIVLVAFAVFGAVRARSELAAAAPFFCCIVLLSPLSWKAHYVILILPVAHLVFRVKTSRKARYLIAAALAAASALFNLTSPRVIGLGAAEWADAHSLVLAGALLIFIACVAIAVTRKFGKQPHLC
ncbi:MAG: glycosyltransferase family 87 protein [Acidobacteriota bacterium]